MKIRKFNESKSGDQLDDLFSKFIDKLSELGRYARTEQSHSNFTHKDKDLVIDTVKEYEDLLKVVNDKFNKVKDKLKETYN